MKVLNPENHYSLTSIIKDVKNQNYLGVDINVGVLLPYFEKLYEIGVDEAEIDHMCELKFKRDRGNYHMTVLAAHEFKHALNYFNITDFKEIPGFLMVPVGDIILHGIGVSKKDGNVAYYVVCTSERLNAFRKKLELPPKDFHITLAFKDKDVHGVPKNIVSFEVED